MRRPALAAALLALAACSRRGGEEARAADDVLWVTPEATRAGAVRVVDVKEQDFAEPVVAPGRVAFDDLRVVHVFSPVTGRVTRVIANPGDRVAKGSALLNLASPDAGSAFADLVKAEADLAAAAQELARQQRIYAAHAGPKRDLEAAEDAELKASAERARAAEKAKLLQVGRGEAVTQEYTLRSFIEGRVISRGVSPGMEVQGQYSGGGGAELFTIGEIDRVLVLADVAEADLPRVRPGAAVEVRAVAYPGRTFAGKVDWIADALDPALRTARVRVSLPNPDRALKPEMYVTARIATVAERRLGVPEEAVTRADGQPFALVADRQDGDGRIEFKRRRLRLAGTRAGAWLAVADGLSAGDRVAIEARPVRAASGAGEARLGERQAEAAGIRTAVVAAQDVAGALQLAGRLSFDDRRVAHVFSPVTGRVTRVLAPLGARVRKGQPLLALASPDVGQALSDLAKAEADRVAAEHERKRQQELVAAHAGAVKDLEAAEGAFKKARAEEERARARTRLLSAGDLDRVTQEYLLRSPIDGTVVARAVNPGLEVQGQWSGAQNAPELFTVGELDRLWILAEVYEQDLPLVRAGQRVEVRSPAAPGEVFRGAVEWVSDALDPVQRTARIRCALENPRRLLKPEMVERVTVSIPGRRLVSVPREALVRRGDETVVFVATARDGELRFRERRVSADEERAEGQVPVLSGLAPGERVVVDGAMFVMGML
ncbi:MAG TPA: efflux RND transporter periplasmic adaptor subunit [Anaeromyxobacteraceae bacterium]|nr:efflux RND transporter periplasmic adaptor subunit [Anaeromyxobacteraceae bacterium]